MRAWITASTSLLFICATLACNGEAVVNPRPDDTITLKMVSALADSGTAGQPLDPPPLVRVENSGGTPVAGARVRFSVTAGEGSVNTGEVVTSADGLASPGQWTLGSRAGVNVLSAALESGNNVRFTVTGYAGPPAQLVKLSGDEQAGLPGEEIHPPAVRVGDRFGNPVAGMPVTFLLKSGDGVVSGTDARTDKSGVARATRWLLGMTPATNAVTATAGTKFEEVFTAKVLDPAALIWFRLESIGGFAPERMYVLQAQIALSPDGYFIERLVYLDLDNERYSGTYTDLGTTDLGTTLRMTISATPRTGDRSYDEIYVKNGDWLSVDRIDYDIGLPVTWTYRRLAARPEG